MKKNKKFLLQKKKLYTTSEFINSDVLFEKNLTTINHFHLIHNRIIIKFTINTFNHFY